MAVGQDVGQKHTAAAGVTGQPRGYTGRKCAAERHTYVLGQFCCVSSWVEWLINRVCTVALRCLPRANCTRLGAACTDRTRSNASPRL